MITKDNEYVTAVAKLPAVVILVGDTMATVLVEGVLMQYNSSGVHPSVPAMNLVLLPPTSNADKKG